MYKPEINHQNCGVVDLPQAKAAEARRAEGYPSPASISNHLQEFIDAIGSDVYTYHIVGLRRAYVFHKDQPFVSVGRISYEDRRARGEGDKPTYNVFSPRLKNPRYQFGSDNHYSKQTSSLTSAVKAARSCLHAFDHTMLFTSVQDAFRGALRQADDEARRVVVSAWKELTGTYPSTGSKLDALLLALASRPDAATLPSGEQLLAYKAAADEYNQPHMDMSDLRFVHRRRGQYWVLDVAFSRKSYHSFNPSGDPVVYDDTNVPPFIQDRLAVLQIVEPGQVVPGVGVSLHESLALVVA